MNFLSDSDDSDLENLLNVPTLDQYIFFKGNQQEKTQSTKTKPDKIPKGAEIIILNNRKDH